MTELSLKVDVVHNQSQFNTTPLKTVVHRYYTEVVPYDQHVVITPPSEFKDTINWPENTLTDNWPHYTVIFSDSILFRMERQHNEEWWTMVENDPLNQNVPIGFRILVRDDHRIDHLGTIRQRCITVRTETSWHRFCYVYRNTEPDPMVDRDGYEWKKSILGY